MFIFFSLVIIFLLILQPNFFMAYKLVLIYFFSFIFVSPIAISYAQKERDLLSLVTQHIPRTLGLPYSSNGRPSSYYWRAMFDTLTEWDTEGRLQAGLAISWERRSPLIWSFKIRHDVFFSNGQLLTSQDVKRTIDWLARSRSGQSTLWGREVRNIRNVDIENDGAILFFTHRPDPILPKRMSGIYILPSNAFKKDDVSDFAKEPIGTGPFAFQTWRDRKGHTVLNSSAKAWRKSIFKKLVLIPAPNDMSRLQAVSTGQADLIANIPVELLPDAVSAGLNIKRIPMAAVQSFMFRTVGNESSPVNDIRVRQAMNYAIDKSLLAELISNEAPASGQGAPTFVFGHNPDIQPYPYDPKKARELLLEAGFDKDSILKLSMTVSANEMTMSLFAQRIVQDLAEVNIEIDLLPTNGIQWLQMYNTARFKTDLFNMAWNSAPLFDASRPLEYTSCIRFRPFFCEPSIIPILQEAQVELDEIKRLELLQLAQEKVHEIAPAIFLFEHVIHAAFGKKLKSVPFRLTVPAYDLIEAG